MSRFSDLLPPLAPGEYEALKADIAERGVLVPIEVDEAGEILDGAHRARAAAELGLAPPARIVRHDLSEEQKRAHALVLNVHRRQLGPEQRRELVARLREEGLSTRRIADAIGVAQTTVVRDLAGEPDGSPRAHVWGQDGKLYPAARPAPPAPASIGLQPPEAEADPLLAVDWTIGTKALVRIAEGLAWVRHAGGAELLVEAAVAHSGMDEFLFERWLDDIDRFTTALREWRQAIPTADRCLRRIR